jgi:senataxin
LGNETTLENSKSIWKELVLDAKERGCFNNADEDEKLSEAIEDALLDIELLDESESPFKKLSLQDRSETFATTSR